MKYERLTKYSEINKDYITPYCDNFICDGVCRDCDYEQIIINRLAELEDKIEDGTLVELPCKVGDAVYIIAKQGLDIYTVEKVVVCDFWYSSIFNDLCPMTADGVPLSEIFLTKAEAEKRLEELRGER